MRPLCFRGHAGHLKVRSVVPLSISNALCFITLAPPIDCDEQARAHFQLLYFDHNTARKQQLGRGNRSLLSVFSFASHLSTVGVCSDTLAAMP